MDKTLWNTKLKKIYETLPTAEQLAIENFIVSFLSLQENAAINIIKQIILNPEPICLRYGLSEEQLITSKSTLINMYKIENPDCWLNSETKPNKLLLESIGDYTLALYVTNLIDETLKKSCLDIERILFLLRSTEEKNIYGGLVSLSLSPIEANYLKNKHACKIAEVLQEGYNYIQSFISPTGDNFSSNNSKSVLKPSTPNELVKEDNKTISKLELFTNREAVLKFYTVLDEIKATPINVSALLEKQKTIQLLLEVEVV